MAKFLFDGTSNMNVVSMCLSVILCVFFVCYVCVYSANDMIRIVLSEKSCHVLFLQLYLHK